MRRILLVAVFFILFPVLVEGKYSYTKVVPGSHNVDRSLLKKIREAGGVEEYPNAHSIIIEDVDSTEFDATGRAHFWWYGIVKVISSLGVKDYGTVKIPYDTLFMSVKIHFARIIKPDGTVVWVGEDDITDETMEGFEYMDIYEPNLRNKVITFPDLEKGDAVEYFVEYNMFETRFEGIFDGSHYFQSTDPVLHSRCVVIGPESKPLNWKVFNDEEEKVRFKRKKKSGKIIYKWWADEMEQVIKEDVMPPFENVTTVLLFSTTDWKGFSRKVYELSEPMISLESEANMSVMPAEGDTTPLVDAIRETVKELIKGKKTDEEKLRAIYYYVAQKIRYLGLPLSGKEAVEPHPVAQTFRNKAGVCKDKSALLATMLRLAGFDAYVALTNPMRKVHAEIAATQFNHMITAIRLPDGNYRFFDSTDDLCMDMLPTYEAGKGVLVATPEGEELMYIPDIPASENTGKIRAVSRVDETGKLTSKVTISGAGIYDEVLRMIVRQNKPEERKRFVIRLLKRISPDAKLRSLCISPRPITNLYEPVRLEIEYEVPDYATVAGKYLLLRLPMATDALDVMSNTLSYITQLETRDYPVYLGYTVGAETNETLEIPSGYMFRVSPDNFKVEDANFLFMVNQRLEGKKILYHKRYELKRCEIPASDYPNLREMVGQFTDYRKSQLVLKKAQ